jgi:hypothetical protein
VTMRRFRSWESSRLASPVTVAALAADIVVTLR